MGGIGDVGTHPDHRDVAYATALMKDATLSMRNSGYVLSTLFSSISQHFCRKIGWESLPLTGFRIMSTYRAGLEKTDWEIKPFEEGRDLEQVIVHYDTYNARQNGSLVRSSEHWGTAPVRLRQILPTVVARRGDRLGGYLDFRIQDKNAHVLEVSIARCDATSFVALVDHLLRICAENGIEQIEGEIPHRHPLVNLLIEGSWGDLFLPGTTAMMLYSLDLGGSLGQVLPDL